MEFITWNEFNKNENIEILYEIKKSVSELFSEVCKMLREYMYWKII